MWAWRDKSSGEVCLPGPASWWPDNIDERDHGFDAPLKDNGHFEAFELVDFEGKRPQAFDYVFPDYETLELRMMQDNPEAKLLIDMMSMKLA
jgi:hypothetical protein